MTLTVKQLIDELQRCKPGASVEAALHDDSGSEIDGIARVVDVVPTRNDCVLLIITTNITLWEAG